MYRDEKTDQSPNKYFSLFLRVLMTLIGLFISGKNVSHHPVTGLFEQQLVRPDQLLCGITDYFRKSLIAAMQMPPKEAL